MLNNKFKEKYRIKSTRLSSWDYSSNGYYFITICVKDRQCLLGEVNDNQMQLSNIGNVINECWYKIPNQFYHVKTDEFVIMPNHIHGIIIIRRDVINHVSTIKNDIQSPMGTGNLGEIIRWFKGICTYKIRKMQYNFAWQPRFYEHIIRNDNSLLKIQEYIRLNPTKWDTDVEHPNNLQK